MRNTLLLFSSLALTVLCWGLYGPVLRAGQEGMSSIPPDVARLRPFVCVGLAYFLIGVIVPSLWLHFRGEQGDWTLRGVVWSVAGGALGALGALGIILAFTFGGRPIYVMPLVFGGAPVVNAFLTIFLARRVKEIGPVFLAALIIVVLGAVVVLVAAPHGPPRTPDGFVHERGNAGLTQQHLGFWTWVTQLLAIALAIVSWGAYGPVLHNGQAAMHHSRMRPLICVGLAYFVIAVIVPYFFLGEIGEDSTYRSLGTLWSLLAGAFGAAGALGIIMAFKSGGRPVFVMPLVFGAAPVVNTFFTIATRGQWDQINPFFWAGLILVVAGSVMVLVLAPRGEGEGRKAEGGGQKAEGRGRKAEGGGKTVDSVRSEQDSDLESAQAAE
jgi:drug/metabolite transporter (DMT)-like permease